MKTARTPKISPRVSFGLASPCPVVVAMTITSAATTKTPIRPKRDERLNPPDTGASLPRFPAGWLSFGSLSGTNLNHPC